MKKICLINPPIDLKEFYWEVKLGSKLPPLGLLSLAAYLRDKGHRVFLIDALNRGISPDEVVERVKQVDPDFVGITATTSFIASAHHCAQKIKTHCPKVTTIIGGAHLSALPIQTIEEFPAFDLGVVGEGEETLLELLEDSGSNYQAIDGIVFRDQGQPVMTGKRAQIRELDQLPFPALDLLDGFPDLYQPTPNNYLKKPVVSLVTSRGCPFSCTFCDQSVFGHRVRAFSPQYVVRMIQFYQEQYGIQEVSFYDDLFTFNKQRLIDFVNELARTGVQVTWSCESRIDTVTDDSLRIMKESGCWQISYGIETGSQKILDYFNKRITVPDIEKAVRLTHQWGMRIRAYLIVGSPPEDQESIEETKALIRRLPLDDLHISFFAPIPGSKAFKDIIGNQIVPWKDMDLYRVGYTPPGISAEELQEAVKGIYRQFYLQPRILFHYARMLLNPYKSLELFQKGLIFLFLLFKREKYH
jgi:anaerobic magnesium-protoporphyrin IX monomethyl ester cyclase